MKNFYNYTTIPLQNIMQTQKKKEQRKNVPSLEVITNHKLNLSIKQTKKKNFKCSNVDTFGMALIKTCSSDGLR